MIIICGIIALIFALGVVFVWRQEYVIWNKGFCSCGGRWINFDTDSQGGRGYKCDTCKTSLWVSYPVDRK